MKISALGVAADDADDKIGAAKLTIIVRLEHFCQVVIKRFGGMQLHSPTPYYISRIVQQFAECFQVFLEILIAPSGNGVTVQSRTTGSTREERMPTVTQSGINRYGSGTRSFGCSDALTTQMWWIHGHCRRVFPSPPLQYKIYGVSRNKPYWLCDSIYPMRPMFIETTKAILRKHRLFLTMPKVARKDIWREFIVMQSMWYIIGVPTRLASLREMTLVMKTNIFLHSMMVERQCHVEYVN